MSEIVTAISNWPVILQGALGSALFAATIYFGRRGASLVMGKYSTISTRRRIEYLQIQRVKYSILSTKDFSARAAYFSGLTYRAARHWTMGAVWVLLGFIGSVFLPVLGVVGYLGGLYYLFIAVNILKGIGKDEDAGQRVKEITEELTSLGES